MLGAMQDWPLRVMRLIDHAAREHGQREIVSRYADGTTVRTDYAGIARDARRLAAALERLGLAKGDRVATLAMNHGRHLVAWYGTIGMGGVIHTVNPRLFAEQLVYIFNHAEDRVLFYDAAFQPLVDALRPQLKTVEHFIRFDGPAGEFEPLLAAETGDYRWVEGDEREPCMLCYTSGTTGNPKGVLYEHRSTVLHAMAEISADCLDLTARTVALPIVPMFHAAAWGLPFAAPLTGAKLVFSADYTPNVMCDLMRAEGVTHSAGVPTVWLAMIQYVEATGTDLAPLKVVTIGGSARRGR
jgi:fatty-acyl-CoA synthase